MLKICLNFTDSFLSLGCIEGKGVHKLQLLGGVEILNGVFPLSEKADITLNSVVEMVLLFHYLVSHFSGCV